MPAQTVASSYERRIFPMLEVKALDDAAGTFSGYLAVFNNIDQGGDKIIPGAFQKSLSDLQTKQRSRQSRYILPIFWSHMPEEPLGGFVEAYEDGHGLYVKGELDLDIEQGRRAYSGLKRGYLSGMSIGYITVKQGYEDGARILKELRLLEGSLTAIPMNEEAQVTAVKSASGKADWPLGDRDAAWDGAGAHNRIVKWATKDDGSVDAGKLQSVHFWYDSAAPDKITSYKLLFCDLVDGKVQAMPKGIFACAGAHGVEGADIPSGDVDAVKAKIAAYYARMAKAFDDDTIVAPWKQSAGGKAASMPMDFNAAFTQLSAADALQDEWGDSFQALVSSLYGVMQLGNQPGDSGAQDTANTILKQFTAHMSDLVARSLEAQFTPCLDDDGDSFYDPDGPNASDGPEGAYGDADDSMGMGMGMMSRDTRHAGRKGTKAGRVMSAANHDAMGKALDTMKSGLDAVKAQHKALADMHAQMSPKADADSASDNEPSDTDTQDSAAGSGKDGKSAQSQAGAGAGAASTDALDRSATPQASNDELSDDARMMALKIKTHLLAMKLETTGKGAA